MPQTDPEAFETAMTQIRQEFAELEQNTQAQQDHVLKHQLDLIIRQLTPVLSGIAPTSRRRGRLKRAGRFPACLATSLPIIGVESS